MRSSTRSSEQEVGVIEDVEGIGIELQIHPLSELEGLGQGHIREPLAWTNEVVSAQVTYARQAGR